LRHKYSIDLNQCDSICDSI